MPNLKMVAPILTALLCLLSCQADPEPGTWQRGTAKACDSCTSDLDCAAGLLCDQDSFACKSVEQLKAKLSDGYPQCDADCWKKCADIGYCYVLPYSTGTFCGPKSDADCASSARCKTGKNYCKYDAKATNGYPGCAQ